MITWEGSVLGSTGVSKSDFYVGDGFYTVFTSASSDSGLENVQSSSLVLVLENGLNVSYSSTDKSGYPVYYTPSTGLMQQLTNTTYDYMCAIALSSRIRR
jgi:hypothetical protein